MRKLVLEAQGYRVLTAANGLDGLSTFATEEIDLVVLDYKMPEMNGDAVAREMRRLRPLVPLIMLSAYPDLPTEVLILFDKSVTKGDDPVVLLTMIQELLERTSPAVPEATLYDRLIDDAVHIMRADFASIQMLFPKRGTGELRLLAFRGFNPEAARFWEWVRADSKSTCGIALSTAQRVVAPDIATCGFMADSEDLRTYLATGIRACQTTPLFAEGGNVVGMISTHWRTPHQPSNQNFRLFDNLATHVADQMDRFRQSNSP